MMVITAVKCQMRREQLKKKYHYFSWTSHNIRFVSIWVWRLIVLYILDSRNQYMIQAGVSRRPDNWSTSSRRRSGANAAPYLMGNNCKTNSSKVSGAQGMMLTIHIHLMWKTNKELSYISRRPTVGCGKRHWHFSCEWNTGKTNPLQAWTGP